MKKTIRNTGFLLLMVAVVGGLIFFLNRADPEIQDAASADGSSEAKDTETLLAASDDEIKTIAFSCEEGAYRMKSFTEVTALSSTDADSLESETQEILAFTLEGLEDYGVDTTAVTTAAQTLYNLTAQNLGDLEDLEAYGLGGEGEGKAELAYQDGTSDTLVIGSVSGSGSGRYVLYEGIVYIVQGISDNLFAHPYKFLDTAVYSVPDLTEVDEAGNETTAADSLQSLKLSGTKFEEAVEISSDDQGSARMVSPLSAAASSEKISGLTTALKSLSATQVVLPGYVEADLAGYELDAPYATVVFNMNGEAHQISVSAPNSDGSCYLIADDTGMIYQIDWGSVSEWADASLMDLRASYIYLSDIMNVETLTFTQPAATIVFDVTRTVDEDASTEDSTSYNLTVNCGGVEIDQSATYQPLYQRLISMTILSVDRLAYDAASPILTVTYTYFEGGSDTLTFFAVEGQDRYVAELNGSFNGVLRKTTLDEVIGLIASAARNEPIGT